MALPFSAFERWWFPDGRPQEQRARAAWEASGRNGAKATVYLTQSALPDEEGLGIVYNRTRRVIG